jgi:hypothetical protein
VRKLSGAELRAFEILTQSPIGEILSGVSECTTYILYSRVKRVIFGEGTNKVQIRKRVGNRKCVSCVLKGKSEQGCDPKEPATASRRVREMEETGRDWASSRLSEASVCALRLRWLCGSCEVARGERERGVRAQAIRGGRVDRRQASRQRVLYARS